MPRSPYKQQRLFAPLGMMRQPHQMSPTQFANSPRTMVHGSDEEDFEELRAGRVGYEDAGFHVGTPAAADERLSTRHMSAVEGYYHPVRVDRSEFLNTPERPWGDMLNPSGWAKTEKPHFYRNEIEDEGSVSAVTDSPDDVKHYADYVHDALDRGGIPSGEAEHFATQLDTEHSEHSPGIPRGRMAIERDDLPDQANRSTTMPGQIRSRIEHRQDLYTSPVTQFHRAMEAKYSDALSNQPSLFGKK